MAWSSEDDRDWGVQYERNFPHYSYHRKQKFHLMQDITGCSCLFGDIDGPRWNPNPVSRHLVESVPSLCKVSRPPELTTLRISWQGGLASHLFYFRHRRRLRTTDTYNANSYCENSFKSQNLNEFNNSKLKRANDDLKELTDWTVTQRVEIYKYSPRPLSMISTF